jgi:hypothetical protein
VHEAVHWPGAGSGGPHGSVSEYFACISVCFALGCEYLNPERHNLPEFGNFPALLQAATSGIKMAFQTSQAAVYALPSGRGAKLAATLDALRRVIEDKFTAAGGLLSQAIEGIESLIASLDRLSETLDETTARTTSDDLTSAANKLLALPASQIERTASLERLNECREAFAEHISNMHCSLAYMRAFTANIKSATADIGGTHDEIGRLAGEIVECIRQGGEELKKVEAELSALQHDVEAALGLGESLGFQIEQLLPMVPDDLTTSARIMSAQYQRIVETAVGVAIIARDIHVRVSRVLEALQIGDLTRQRIEHIQAGVILLDIGDPALEAARRDRLAAYGYALLSAQLADAADEFYHEVSEMDRSMTGMAADARELLQLHDLAYGSNGSSDGGGFLHRLANQVTRAIALVGETDYAEQTAICTGRNVAESAHELCTRIAAIQAIRNDVQTLATDTGAKCTELGESGRTMNAIAAELRKYAGHMEIAASEGLSIAERLGESATTLAESESVPGNGGSAEAATALNIASQRIADAQLRTETDIPALVAKGDSVLKTLEISAAKLGFQTEIGAILDQARVEMAAFGEGVCACSDDIAEPLGELLAGIARQYSMAQEREIHRNMLKSWGIHSGGPVQAPVITDDNIDDVLF